MSYISTLGAIFMDCVKMISHNTYSGVDDLKTACLYFDLIEVANHFRPYILGDVNAKPQKHKDGKYYVPGRLHIEEHFISSEFKSHIQPLIEQGLVSLKYEPYMTEEIVDKKRKYMTVGDPSLKLNSFVLMNYKKFFKTVEDRQYEDEHGQIKIDIKGQMLDEVQEVSDELDKTKKETLNFVFKYYGHLASAFLRNLDKGEKLLTTSSVLHDFIVDYYNSPDFKETRGQLNKTLDLHPSIVFDAIKLAVPNLSRLSIDDVLDIRLKLKDELLAFKDYNKSLQLEFELDGMDEKYLRAKSIEIVNVKIRPALEDLERKLKDLNLSIPTSILKEVKDPKSYSPLLLSFTNNISNTYAILVSLGIISFSTAVDYYKAKREVKRNGLYYLLKLKNYA